MYPGYNVLDLQDEWDPHTREIVNRRLGPFTFKLLSPWEQAMIKAVAEHLICDGREEILEWVAFHVDEQLAKPFGEAQRKPGVPPQKELVRRGLKALDLWAKKHFSEAFLKLDASRQLQLISSFQQGSFHKDTGWETDVQKEFFKKVLGLVTEAYYCHPWVWSEIGYGGPAYPRGYVRIELGITDPWEPRRVGTNEGS